MANDLDRRGLARRYRQVPAVRDPFSDWSMTVLALINICFIILSAHTANGQTRPLSLQNILHQNAAFDETDFDELHRGEPVVACLPPNHKQEVAVYGLIRVQVPAEVFLQSFRETLAAKSNPAILEIGRFNGRPTLDDLKTLTLGSRDIEDLKKCVIGNCELKLSAKMIDQFQRNVDWQSADYADQATLIYRQMLLEYVRDYLSRGDGALIEYSDKSKRVSLLEGQRALLTSLPTFLTQNGKSFSTQGLVPVENAIVWSKIEFGLKPVVAINHTLIFKNEQAAGPQILVLSKQIYASHYFDASIALTGLVTNAGADQEYYLFYENHSLADGLQGIFSGIKRGLIEREAVEGLKGVLRATKVRLDARVLNQSESGPAPISSSGLLRLRVPRKQLLFLVFCITALVMLVLAYQRKATVRPRTHAS